ncbi:MAG: glycerophosphodiester phosphodiesterase [Candidatus Rokubacteria bacterium]|nr:glycerophosphodiester phosphodiesterase [Candidatus Rokubacteria bacterium]
MVKLAVTVGVALIAVLGGPVGAQSGTLLAAHRGGALLWPENSLLAFRNAIALRADFLELDVHLTKDGEADEVVGLAAPANVRLLLEIKLGARREPYPGIEGKVLTVLERHLMAARAVVMAFDGETLRRVRKLRPELMVGGLYSPRSLEGARSTLRWEIEALETLGARFVGVHQELVTEGVIEQAKKAGLLVGVWTVNEERAMKRFIELGVDILITDRPDLARDLLRR